MPRSASLLLASLVLALVAPATAAPRAGRLSLDDLRRMHLLRAAPAPKAALVPPALTAHLVGDPRSFWTYDLSVMPPKNKQVAATCRAVGTTVAVFVADTEWPQKVDPTDVDAIVAAFDTASPIDDGMGISARNAALFGQPSDIDGDGQLIVFIFPIAGYQGNTFDGFFRAEDLGAFQAGCATNPQLYCSNEAEMVHVNSTNPGSPYMIGVMAHEAQHLTHFVADPNEDSWINEAMSELAMSAGGYEDTGNLHAYLANPAAPLETTEFVDYGAVLLWGTWLYERFGADFVRALVAAPANGKAGLAAAWASLGQAMTYEETFADWALATVVDGPGALGYQLLELPHFAASGALPALVDGQASGSLTVPPSSYRWLQGVVPTPGALAVSIPADAKVGLRVATYVEGASTLATEIDVTTFTVEADALANPVVVVIANPTLTSQTVTVSFNQNLARPEPEDEPQPEPIVEVVEPSPDSTTYDGVAPDATTPDTTTPEVATADVTDDASVDAEPNDGAGGGCAIEEIASPGALPLLLSALALLLVRRVRRS